jgi:hypothetical protein
MNYTSALASANLRSNPEESGHLRRPLSRSDRTKPPFSRVAKKGGGSLAFMCYL